MARRYIFADEAGDFVFKKDGRASRYFIVCTMTMDSCDLGARLLDLRRQLAWGDYTLQPCFHATEDKAPVRDEVYKLIAGQDFKIQATVMEKSKAMPQVRTSDSRFYHYGWFYHLQYASRYMVRRDAELLFTTAQVDTKKARQATFTHAVNDSLQQTVRRNDWKTHFCLSAVDPCLQIVDYCTWAIQRKWERGQSHWYDLIKGHIQHEAEMWRKGSHHYY